MNFQILIKVQKIFLINSIDADCLLNFIIIVLNCRNYHFLILQALEVHLSPESQGPEFELIKNTKSYQNYHQQVILQSLN